MKGLVFREFLEMVEKEFGYSVADTIIEKSAVSGKGAYTTVGTYPHHELVALVTELSIETRISKEDLLYQFGKYLFSLFQKRYPSFFEGKSNSFELLEDVEKTIHVEVLKLYPGAELPAFDCKVLNSSEMTMLYKSGRRLSDFAAGLIDACLTYFNEKASVEKKDISGDGSMVLFTITKFNE